jgi:hypothetical protein
MTKVNKTYRSILSIGLAALFVLIWPATAFAATDPLLNTAGPFAILAGQSVTNTGASVVNGQVGVSPGAAATNITGFGGPPNGTINGAVHDADSVALAAQNDLTQAYTRAANQVCPGTNNFTGVNLAGRTLVPGTYCQTTAPPIVGTLTLDGSGCTGPTCFWVFQIGSTLLTAAGAPGAPATTIALINAQPCQVFWQVSSSATIATYASFVGTIMALTSIGMFTGATLQGRALARNGSVTLQTNTINLPAACTLAPAPGASPSPGVVPGSTGIPDELMRGQFPWLLVMALGAGIGAIALGYGSRRRRRRQA